MAEILYYVSPESGVNVAGIIGTASSLPTGAVIIQAFTPVDGAGNGQLFNADGSVKQLATGSAFTAMPSLPSTNGTPLTNGPTGVEITCPPGTSVTYTIAAAQPTSVPTLVRTFANANGATSFATDKIPCAAGVAVYVVSETTLAGVAPFYRSY